MMPKEEGLLLLQLLDFSSYICKKKISLLFSSPSLFSFIYFYKKFISVFTINFFIFTRHDYVSVCWLVCVCMGEWVSVRMWKTSLYIYTHLYKLYYLYNYHYIFLPPSSSLEKTFFFPYFHSSIFLLIYIFMLNGCFF